MSLPYYRAGVAEYWLVDARRPEIDFQILVRGDHGYVSTEVREGWLFSKVFNHSFQLRRDVDPLGHPDFTLAVQA